MGEVKRYIADVATCVDVIPMESVSGAKFVLATDYATLEAENAKLRAGQESLLLNLAEQKRQAVEYREMWAKAAERAHSQSSDLALLAEYIVGREYGTALPNYEALGRYPLDVAEAALSAPSAPKCPTCRDVGVIGHSQICPECADTWEPAPKADDPVKVQGDGWIHVNDAVPNTAQEVVVFSEFDGVTAGFLDSYDEWYYPNSNYKLTRVSHWMPLPAAPAIAAARKGEGE